LAYDPATQHFWTASFSSSIYEFDKTGAIINTFSNPGLSIYGMAWDEHAPDGPWLWIWSQDGIGCLATQFDPVLGVATGVTYDGTVLPGSNIAGGACIAEFPFLDTAVFVGLSQATPDTIVGYEMYDVAGPGGPDIEGCASGVVLIEYRVWYNGTWGPWTMYWNTTDAGTGPFTLEGGCTHYLQYRAVDCLGNTLYCEEDLIPPLYRGSEYEYQEIIPGEPTVDPIMMSNDLSKVTVETHHRGIIYDNTMTATNLGASQWDPISGLDPICADDFVLSAPDNTVHGINFIAGYWNPASDGNFDWEITFYNDGGNEPGTIFAGPYYYANADVHETPIGGGYFEYWVNLSSDVLFVDGVTYWISIQGYGAFPPQSGFGMHTSPINGNGGMLKSIYFGFPDWTDWLLLTGSQQDFAFQLVGPELPPPPPPPNITVYNQTHYVDLEPPRSWIALELDHHGQIITPYTEFTIFQEDEACDQPLGSQCCFIRFSIDGPPGSKFYWGGSYYEADGTWRTGPPGLDTPVAFQIRDETGYQKTGAYTIQFYAEDCFGNIETVIHSHTYFPDPGAPTTTLLFTGPYYEDQDEWITSETLISLDADDTGSGTKVIKYKIDNSKWRYYEEPFTLPTEGKHVITYYGKDWTNNVEDEKIKTVIVDSTAPETSLGFEGDIYDDEDTKWITTNTHLQLPSSDATGCGIAATYYRIDSGDWTEYTGVFTLETGTLIEFYAEDHLGNTGPVQQLSIGIDKTAPSITFVTPQDNHLYIAGREILALPAQTFIVGSLRIDVGATDACGIEKLELYIDGEQRYMEPDDSLQWLWDEKSIFSHLITVKAYDNLGRVSTKETTVRIFNF
jgi:hypothetical protein